MIGLCGQWPQRPDLPISELLMASGADELTTHTACFGGLVEDGGSQLMGSCSLVERAAEVGEWLALLLSASL